MAVSMIVVVAPATAPLVRVRPVVRMVVNTKAVAVKRAGQVPVVVQGHLATLAAADSWFGIRRSGNAQLRMAPLVDLFTAQELGRSTVGAALLGGVVGLVLAVAALALLVS